MSVPRIDSLGDVHVRGAARRGDRMCVRRDSGGVSVAVMRRSDRRGEREAGLPSCALSIIHDPTLGRARRAEVTARDEDRGKWCFWIFRLMENKSKRDK